MAIQFTLNDEPMCVGGMFAELKLSMNTDTDDRFIIKMFYPYRMQNGCITISESLPESYNNNLLELFIKNIKNDKNCAYYRDGEVIFQYLDGAFIVEPMTYNTICNFDVHTVDFILHGHKELIVDTLTQLHNWLKSLY
jgi:hypothetical protein